MRKTIFGLLALVLCFAAWPSYRAQAATEDYPGKYLPVVEVKVNVGNTEFADDAFLDALIEALKVRGVGASKIDVGYAGSVDTDFSVTDPANWTVFDHFGWWEEIGGSTNIWSVFETYLSAHVTGFDPDTMWINNGKFDVARSMLQLEYYDGTEYKLIDYKDLSGLSTRISANLLDFDVRGWAGSLEPTAVALIEGTTEGQTLGIDDLDEMWYDASDKTAYIGWYDSTNYDWHTTAFQAYEDYIGKSGFLSGLVFNSSGFYSEYGYINYYDAPNDDYFEVRFSPVEYGGVEPSHYPSPDENPDADNPVNWTNDPHIVIHENGQVVFYGYGSPAFKDFLLSVNDAVSDKHFSFDLDESKVDYHSMEGGGFLFSILVNDQDTVATDDDTMSGYSVLFTEDGTNLYRLTDVNIATFHDTEDDEMEYISGIELLQSGEKDTSNDQHKIQIDVVNNVLTVKDNDVVAFDGLSLDTVGNQFGPLVSYGSHGCSQLSYFVYDNLKMGTSIKVVSKAQDNVGTTQWTDGAFHVYINLEDTHDTSLVVDDFVKALKEDGALYIGIGLNASKVMHDAIVAGNGKGTYFGYGSYPQSLSDMATAVAEYLWPLLETPTIDNIRNVVLDEKVISDLPTKPVVIIPGGILDVFDDLMAGHDVTVELDISVKQSTSVTEGEKALLDTYLASLGQGEATKLFLFDITLMKYLDGTADEEITSTLKPITIVIQVPEAMRNMTSFKIARIHDGKLEILPVTYDPVKFTLTFTTDKFSTYAIQYTDPDVLPNTGDAANWGWIIGLAGLVLVWMTKRSQYE